jgi:hypothetical protein
MAPAYSRTAICFVVIAQLTIAPPAFPETEPPRPDPGQEILRTESAVGLTGLPVGEAGEAEVGGLFVPVRSRRARVAVAGTQSPPLVGRFLEARGDTLTIVEGKQELDIPCREITRIEVGRGFRRTTARGALVGLFAGGGLGVLLGAADNQGNQGFIGQGAAIAAGAVALGLIGMGVGAMVGHKGTHEWWDEVKLDDLGAGLTGDVWIPAPAGLPLRVTAPLWGEGSYRGASSGRAGDSLVLVSRNREVRIPTRSITKVEAAWGTKGFGSWGARIGFAGGFVAGVLVAQASPAAVGMALALPGALFGSIVGSQMRVQRWEELPLQAPPLQSLNVADRRTSPGISEPEPPPGEAPPGER